MINRTINPRSVIDSRTWCCSAVTWCHVHAAHSLALCIIPGRITMTMTAITIEPDRIGEGASRQLGKLLTNNAATGGETAIRRGVVSSCEPQCSKSSRAGVHPFAHNRPWDTPSSTKNRYDFYHSSVHIYIYIFIRWVNFGFVNAALKRELKT